MDTDESCLRPCKQLPSPTNDRQPSHAPMGQHLGLQSTNHGHIDQWNDFSPPSTSQEETEDEASEFEDGEISDAFDDKTARLLKGKEKATATVAQKKGPLQLLDLPLDVLKIILKEVTHTNDLANCAKVNSALHSLVTPMIYSRFDIVWPDTLSSAEPTRGVDALTYGLATLVMREDLFENVLYPNSTSCAASCQSVACPHCGSISYLSKDAANSTQPRRSRRGNYFSQFVKKFSLGNGPSDWVQEYLVTKESGKMLGTLVALSIARMPNLESFVWDMPTGILRDIWIALSSLGDHQQPKLKKLWVRFHDNRVALKDAGLLQPSVSGATAQSTTGPSIALPPSPQSPLMNPEHYGVKKIAWVDHHVESPNFSVMPPLSSLTVLDIDEVRYLEELTVLLARSVYTLRELRIGMANTLNIPPCAQQLDHMALLFKGGVLPLLLSKMNDYVTAPGASDLSSTRVEDNFKGSRDPVADESNVETTHACPSSTLSPIARIPAENISNMNQSIPDGEDHENQLVDLTAQVADVTIDAIDPALFGQNPSPPDDQGASEEVSKTSTEDNQAQEGNFSEVARPVDPVEKFKLEVLEIERLTKLNPLFLYKSIDFNTLTSLTLLQCGDCSALWDRLRKEFAPRITRVTAPTTGASDTPSHARLKPSSKPLASDTEYRLKLKKIHTDAVSSDLISFLKNTLAPNSLEWLFLQDTELFPSPVTLEAIYRGPIRRHRSSLTKLLIDSAYGQAGTRSRTNTARKWMLNRDILVFFTSGKMCRIRELGIALEYKDWHFLLQRLPNIPHLRSLYVPNISDHPHANNLNVKDFALGVIDVVALRPEVELCYLGIKGKCFEILERKLQPKGSKPKGQGGQGAGASSPSPAGGAAAAANDTTSDDDTEDDHGHDDDESEDDTGTATNPPPAIDPGAMDSDTGSITTEDEDEEGGGSGGVGRKGVRLKLREILFYDDKISIFKARHGRL